MKKKKNKILMSVIICSLLTIFGIYFLTSKRTPTKEHPGTITVDESKLKKMQEEAKKEGKKIEIHGGPLDNVSGN